MKDLWGFTKESLEADNSIINKVLNDQARLLAKKTDGILQGKVSNRIIAVNEDENLLETTFEVLVPNLENYVANLFYVYSKPAENFPVYITYKRVLERIITTGQIEVFFNNSDSLQINCENEIEDIIGKVLSSQCVNNTIKVLYQKGSVTK